MRAKSSLPSQQAAPEIARQTPTTAVSERVEAIRQGKTSLLAGRAFSGRAEERHKVAVLQFVVLLLTAALVYSNYAWWKHADRLGEKQYVVFHDQGGRTTVAQASDFQTGPSDAEIQGRAWDVVRWVVGAGSANVDTAFAEAKKLMTPEMRADFERDMESRRQSLRELGIYQRIENGAARQMTESDLPPGSRARLTRYDVIVTGTLDAYRLDTNERLATGPFAYHVQLVPLDRRTVDNPSGLLVSHMSAIQLPRPAPSPGASPQRRSNE